MIKANELRRGNYVLDYDGKVIEVEVIDECAINESWDGPIDPKGETYRLCRGISLDDIDPIPLTPEWLERCMFDYREDDKVWAIQVGNTCYLEFDEQIMCGVTPETWRDQCPIYIWADVKYLHQLQNLYFALTGEELEIKEA